MPLGDEDALEPGRVEHRGDANEAGTDLDPATLGIDRVGLYTGGPASRAASTTPSSSARAIPRRR